MSCSLTSTIDPPTNSPLSLSLTLHDNPHSAGVPGTPIESVCHCTWLKVHRECLASWQLVNAGSHQEHACRFCDQRLPDWRSAHAGRPMADPVMSVVFDGQIHQIKVSSGTDGKASFEADIRRIFRLSADDELSLTFGCRVPGGGENQELTLEGWASFDAARGR